MNNDLLYQIALSIVPNVGPVQAKILAAQFSSAKDIFSANPNQLMKLDGIGEMRARSIKSFRDFKKAETELAFIEKNNITPLYINHTDYPKRLLHCYDPPTLLYAKGTANLNASRVVAIIGTRNHSAYGKQLTDTLLAQLARKQVLVISGLAYGIDAIAHQQAIVNNLSTVGVLAHGLDIIYPQQHLPLARAMIQGNGALLTEFMSGNLPDKHNFPIRNRIVAGMSDATIVVETGVRGGSMITAELANDYNRDVFAFPGRVTDQRSLGCNWLIKNNKASLIQEAADLFEFLNWNENETLIPVKQRRIFVDLSPEEQVIMNLLKEKAPLHIDELRIRSGLSNSMTAQAILNLEMQQIIVAKPGKLYVIQ